jgi:hypothetical protein
MVYINKHREAAHLKRIPINKGNKKVTEIITADKVH